VRGSDRDPHIEENTMKYMLIMRSTDESFEAAADVDFSEIIEAMGRFNDEMVTAGVLVAAEGLEDASLGVVVDYSSQPPVVTDGPSQHERGDHEQQPDRGRPVEELAHGLVPPQALQP
jgi:hypothetical protein